MSPTTDPAEPIARELGLGPTALAMTPDPAFSAKLRKEVRGAQARSAKVLGWFDLQIPVARLRVVHDGQLIHLVTNDVDRFDAVADARLGFEPPFQPADSVARALSSVLKGRGSGAEVAYLGALSPFHRSVLEATARIPIGGIRPYAWVAKQAGSPGAVRAAGTALGHNPVPFLVPCHRVVRSDWQLGEYSAGGTVVKEAILRWEHVDTDGIRSLATRGRFFGVPSRHTFCLAGCEIAVLSPNPIPFASAEAALASGFRPCPRCRPD